MKSTCEACNREIAQTLREILDLIKTLKELLKMKTVKTVRIDAETDRLQFGVWIPDESGKDGDYIMFDELNAEQTEEMAARLGWTPLGVASLMILVEDIKELVGADLVSIWQRLNDAGIK